MGMRITGKTGEAKLKVNIQKSAVSAVTNEI